MLYRVIVVLIFQIPTVAFACYQLPDYLYASHTELVERTDTIVLARAVDYSMRAKKPSGRALDFGKFTFEKVRLLKGMSEHTFTVNGYVGRGADTFYEDYQGNLSPGLDVLYEDFDAHRLPYFWKHKELGRSTSYGDCNLHGVFVVGETYLLFVGPESHTKGFENVREPEDLWLKAIEKIVKSHNSDG